MNDFVEFFRQLWRIFDEVQVPALNISFAQLWIGVFVVAVSISILRPLLGIGASAARSIIGVGKRSISNSRRRGSRSSEGSD